MGEHLGTVEPAARRRRLSGCGAREELGGACWWRGSGTGGALGINILGRGRMELDILSGGGQSREDGD